ncbi:hypothetical protein EHYA_07683 [Embleya hyalina]|uniref:Uncharacterized protein n=1 Tax=Embleya hyalina TaxID=516124 RepID=A0A401YZA7_9ACTN|nr:hypothetical protein EHYA_07683 [Embleya hyalina]
MPRVPVRFLAPRPARGSTTDPDPPAFARQFARRCATWHTRRGEFGAILPMRRLACVLSISDSIRLAGP